MLATPDPALSGDLYQGEQGAETVCTSELAQQGAVRARSSLLKTTNGQQQEASPSSCEQTPGQLQRDGGSAAPH